MKTRNIKIAVPLGIAMSAFCLAASAGTYKHITIDGSFGDWAGVPVAYTQEPDTTLSVAYTNIYVANDENYLYIRFAISAPANPFTSIENIFIDGDGTSAGYSAGGYIGSEMLIQGGAGYQQRNGGFNEGGINGLDWNAAPAGAALEFEARISRHSAYASDSAPVFTSPTIALVFESEDSGYVAHEWVPAVTGGLSYTFADPPAVLTTNLTLVTLAGSSWQANAAGTDLSTAWLAADYNDTQSGWVPGNGLFGYTPTPAAYPPINTPLAGGPTTYYFRTHLNWDNLTDNLAFVITNYLSDGAVVYVNGQEAARVRMPEGTIAYATTATGTNAPVGQVSVFGIDGSLLSLGDNILQVETHQAPASSADMVFGLSLTAAAQYPILNVDSTQPADRTVNGGDSTTFSAKVLGSGPLLYQWLLNGGPIAGATNASYTIPQVLYTDAGAYSLRVSNPLSTNTTRAAVLSVVNVPVTFADASQPADQVVVEGRSVTLAAVVAGSPPFQYQWYKGSNPLPNETNATFTLAYPLLADAGSYYVNVSNPANSTNSRTSSLTVLRDTLAPALSSIAATATRIVLTFSEPLDAVTAANAGHYTLSGGINVTSATLNPNDPTQVTLTTSSPLTLGVVYTLTVNGVKDLFGNTALTVGSLAAGIVIDGDFSDWAALAPIYSGPAGVPDAADFKDIYIFDDANNYYFRVTLWSDVPPDSGRFPDYANLYFDTDNNVNTGHLPSTIGAELLTESGFGYEERNGGFNEGGINGLGWVSLPAVPGTNFEFSISKAARYASDNAPVFTTNVLNFHFQGQTSGWAAVNEVPPGGVLSYTNATTVVPPLPPGGLAASAVPGNRLAIVWDTPSILQAKGSLTTGSWTNVPAAVSPFVVPATGGQMYFRLAQ